MAHLLCEMFLRLRGVGLIHPGGLRARAGVHLDVPLAATPGRDLGSGSTDRQLPRLPRRATRIGEEGCRDQGEGPYFACINCGLCVDACDAVMAKLARPRGLIDYEAWANIDRGHRGEPQRRRVIRPKTVGLGLGILALIGLMGMSLGMRSDTKITVIHDRNPVAVRLSDGRIRNGYAVRLYNKAARERFFRLEVAGLEGASVEVVGGEDSISVASDATGELRVLVTSPADERQNLAFILTDLASGCLVTAQDTFIPIEGGY